MLELDPDLQLDEEEDLSYASMFAFAADADKQQPEEQSGDLPDGFLDGISAPKERSAAEPASSLFSEVRGAQPSFKAVHNNNAAFQLPGASCPTQLCNCKLQRSARLWWAWVTVVLPRRLLCSSTGGPPGDTLPNVLSCTHPCSSQNQQRPGLSSPS